MRKNEPSVASVLFFLLLFLAMSAIFWYRDSMMMNACEKSGKSLARCQELLR